MRATEKKLRDRHARLPEQYKKVDTTVNGDAEHLIEERSLKRTWFLCALATLPLST